MTTMKLLSGRPAPPALAASVYGGLLLVLIAATALPIKSVLDQRAEVGSLTDTLRLLEAHAMAAAPQSSGPDASMSGSAFLEGATITVAGAALLQRVGNAVVGHGGSVSSSQLDLQGPRAKDGHISVIANFEVGQPDLQPILYDLEAGMPCLFVDELVVEASSPVATPGGKLRVLMTVSGQWQAPR
jgi:general secretion pathway protein M